MILPTFQADVIVVGAGLSGLLAAGKLESAGARVVVLDKGKTVGGRLATRQMGGAVFDHGAQYFTVRDPAFEAIVQQWREIGIVRPWATGFALPDGNLKRDGVERFCGVSGMSAIARHLAARLDVRLNATVDRVASEGDRWTVMTENAERFASRALLLTAPVPQSLGLLAAGDLPLSERCKKELEQIEYAPCLALLVFLSGPSLVPDPGGLWLAGEPVRWIADNQRKGISPGFRGAITVHAGSDYSRQHWDRPAREVTEELLMNVAPWLGTAPVQTQLHRWRYSQPMSVCSEPCLAVESPAPLVFAGDAFGGPRVEGAVLSGLGAADALMKLLR